VNSYLDILGKRVRDLITDYKGVATSVSFDLYGCVQVFVNPGLDEDNNIRQGHWFDYKRLKTDALKTDPLIKQPEFAFTKEAGPENKPAPQQ
jgi:hypothetical protein